MLLDAGFFLYDLTTLQRLRDGTLGWFYPVYVSGKLAHLKPQAFWDAGDNAAVIGVQETRRNDDPGAEQESPQPAALWAERCRPQ